MQTNDHVTQPKEKLLKAMLDYSIGFDAAFQSRRHSAPICAKPG
jgi:hypothetical protein